MAQKNYRIAYLTEDVTKDQLLSFVENCVWLEVEMDFHDGGRWLIADTEHEQVYNRLQELNEEHHQKN